MIRQTTGKGKFERTVSDGHETEKDRSSEEDLEEALSDHGSVGVLSKEEERGSLDQLPASPKEGSKTTHHSSDGPHTEEEGSARVSF